MNNNAQLWLDALESGEYEQTKEVLRRDEGFCCLGVACDIYHEATGDGEWIRIDGGSYEFVAFDYTASAYLPDTVRKWLGLDHFSGRSEQGISAVNLEGNRINWDSLVHMNDGGQSFAAIAEALRENPHLFVEDEYEPGD